jgi:hypothetical protein
MQLTRQRTIDLDASPSPRRPRHATGAKWSWSDDELAGFCQVIEADTVIRHTRVSIWTSLSPMPPAPCLSFRPNSRIDSASLDDSRPLIATAAAGGSVGQWVHTQTENAGHGPLT